MGILFMTEGQRTQCHSIIHTAAVSAGGVGAGLAQLPMADTIPITAIQIGMIISLGAVFGKEITEAVAHSILSGAIASVGGRAISQFLVGWLPGLGNIINAGTAASITEAVGWYAANTFSGEN